MAKDIIIDENRGFQGVWIPKNLYMTNKFNARTKFFIVEVKSLSKNGYCYATDKHFADFLGISERMVQNIINDLKKRNYIRTEYEYDGDTKAIKRRFLILTQVFYNEFYNEKEENNGTEKNSVGVLKKTAEISITIIKNHILLTVQKRLPQILMMKFWKKPKSTPITKLYLTELTTS